MLNIQSLHKSYNHGKEQGVIALKGISLNIRAGEFVSIMGPSGSGKSSLLQICGGLDRPTSGEVTFNNVQIHKLSDLELSLFRRRQLGFVFQFFNLLPLMNAVENICLPLLLDGRSLSQVEGRALKLLEMMDLKKRAYHKPHEMSGGELQRVAIARALITKPLLILADEPTGNLDSKSGVIVLNLLKEISQSQNQAILMVTHDRNAANFGSRIVHLRDGVVETDEKVN
ncbi:MAG: ABC transporter ATP-binding protein [Bdellovibrionales bacterium]